MVSGGTGFSDRERRSEEGAVSLVIWDLSQVTEQAISPLHGPSKPLKVRYLPPNLMLVFTPYWVEKVCGKIGM